MLEIASMVAPDQAAARVYATPTKYIVHFGYMHGRTFVPSTEKRSREYVKKGAALLSAGAWVSES